MSNVWPSFIAATHKEVVSVVSGNIDTVHKGEGEYYGITWDQSNVYLAHKKNDPSVTGPKVVILDSKFNKLREVAGTFPDVHQLLYTQGALHVTNTGTNCIDVVGETSIVSHNWTKHTTDVNHINSLFYDGKSFWSCHHNLVSRGDHTYSELVNISSDFSRVISCLKIGRDLHNVFVEGNYVYTLSSADEELLKINLSTGKVEKRLYIGMWPRGFAATKDFFLVGVSTKIDRSRRPDGRSEIHLVDRNSFQVIDSMRIDDVGVMYELRVTSEVDLAHNEFKFPEST